MVKIIAALLKRGSAYKKAGSVYFDISKFRPYGRLAHLDLKGLKAGARVEVDEYTKKEAQDFVLWKTRKSGEPYWDSPFGKGRPGWHIECSAMSTRYLGQPFDIHTGAVDLIFPHHENEIAQSEAAYGRKFVRYWMHGEHLLVDDRKMAKSLGNVFTLRALETRDLDPLAFRYLILTSHYRSKLNFTWKSITASQNSLSRLYDLVRGLAAQSKKLKDKDQNYLLKFKKGFQEAISNDLDTPRALAVVWDLIHQYNKSPKKFNSQSILNLLYDFDKVLGLGLKTIKTELVPSKIAELAKKREKFRQEKKWQPADKIRKEIKKLGYLVEDTSDGPKLRKI